MRDLAAQGVVSVKNYRGCITVLVIAGTLAITTAALPQGPNHQEQKALASGTVSESSGEHGSPVSPAAKVSADYVIGPDDVLDVSVWKEQDLTRTLQVRPDGRISMPLLNDVQAAGFTPSQLAQTISERLKKYLTAPQVTIIVTQINSQRVYVIGEVTRPGAYPLLPGMTILQAISSAGGLTQFANSKKIFLMRNENHIQTKYPFSYKEVLDGRKAEENLPVKAGDTIVVP
jgi:polysaccharide biosynthesis/export protein